MRRKRRKRFPVSYLRQYGIFDPGKFTDPITLVGCGGIGSSLAMTLAKLGIKNLVLIDDDIVEPHNIPNQAYYPDDIGKPKVEALAKHVSTLGAEPTIYQSCLEDKAQEIQGLVCSGLDSMPPRENLWEIVKEQNESAYFDGRLGGQKIVLYGVDLKNDDYKLAYEDTLHPEDEAEELPCTERAIIDVAYVIGGLITRGIRKYIKDEEVSFVQYINWDDFSINSIPSASDYCKANGIIKGEKSGSH